MKVLVTGGAGFIGSYLAARLVRHNHQVFVIDNESTGRREAVPAAAAYRKGDVTRIQDLQPLFAYGLDAVCHIAGQVSMIRSFTDPLRDLRTNVEGTVQVLQMCMQHRVPRLLYASSMTVYGHPDALPISEDQPCRPCSYYGITKFAAERYVHSSADRPDFGFDFRVTSFRMYSVYGPGQALDNPYQGVLGIFLGNLLRGEPITIYGDGEQSRDFVYIDDAIDLWTLALARPTGCNGVFNLGSGARMSINELADHCLSAFGHLRGSYAVRYAPARPGEQHHVEANIAKARHTFHWQPRVSFADGLAETVRWAKNRQIAISTRPAARRHAAPRSKPKSPLEA